MEFEGYNPPAAAITRSSPGPDERHFIRQAIEAGKTEDEVVELVPEVDAPAVRATYKEFKPPPPEPVKPAAKKKADPLE